MNLARRALSAASVELDLVERALDDTPALGVLMSSGIDRQTVLGGLLGEGERPRTMAARTRDTASAVAAAMPGDSAGGAGPVLRFALAGTTGAPEGFPLSARLLGLADIAAILAKVRFELDPGARFASIDHDRLATVFADAGQALSAAVVAGLTPGDVDELRFALASALPDVPALDALSASSYWDDLSAVAAHLPLAARLGVLAILWGEHAGLTRIAHRLAEALSRVGFANAVFCPREAVFQNAHGLGWPASHPLSVLACRTLHGLGDDADEPVRVVGRFGHQTTLPRAVLAAILAEATLPLPASPLPDSPADLLVFPSPAAQRSQPALAALKPEAGAPDGTEPLMDIFARSKARYLFERACRRHAITSLIVAIDPGTDADDSLAPLLIDWIDLAHGSTPADRETSHCRLFVAVLRTPDLGESSAPQDFEQRADEWRERLARALGESVGGDHGWMPEWIPGEPFSNVFLCQPAELPQASSPAAPHRVPAAPHDRRLGGHLMVRASEGLGHFCQLPHESDLLERALVGPDGGFARLARAAAATSTTDEKLHQLRRALAETRRALRAHLDVVGIGTADDAALERRRRAAAVIEHRIGAFARRHRLGHLLAALTVSDDVLRTASRQICLHPREAGNRENLRRATVAPGSFHAPAGSEAATSAVAARQDLRALARTSIDTWAAVLHDRACSARLAQEIGLPRSLFHRLVDEILIGADRCGLETRLEAVLSQVMASGATEVDHRVVVSAGRVVINNYLERLSLDPAPVWAREQAVPRKAPGSTGPFIHPAVTSLAAPVASPLRASSPWQSPAVWPLDGHRRRSLATSWGTAFRNLVAANIASLAFSGSRNRARELAGLLASLENLEAAP
ncbi:MAG: virulence factor SrfC family protein [Hyphomicrobiaceae bacterium]